MTIAEIILKQAGYRKLNGAFNLVGTRQIVTFEDAPLTRIDFDADGWMDCVNGLKFKPNVNAHNVWFFVILQPNDTYTVWLYKGYSTRKIAKTGKAGQILQQLDRVYCDQLIDVIDKMYVDYISKYQDGFIRI